LRATCAIRCRTVAIPKPAQRAAAARNQTLLHGAGGKLAYWKANVVRELTDEAIDARLEHAPKLPPRRSTRSDLRTLRAARGQGIL
jgi:hypothetical protein